MRLIDLAVNAGKKRQSPRTGFVHYFPKDEHASDTIPVFENFCFALALFRQKTTESVLEGKEIVERLLGFQTPDGNFPIYLHDFPKCWDFHMGLKIAPILIHVLKEFGSVLNAAYKEMLELALKKMIKPPKSPAWESRYKACLGERPSGPIDNWFEWIVSDQLFEKGGSYPIPYNRELKVFLGETPAQERGEPEPLPIEYILAEKGGFDKRLLRDHPHQIYSGLLYPLSSSIEIADSSCWASDSRFLWKGEQVHSLVIPGSTKKGDHFVFELPEGVEIGRDDVFEAILYSDVSPETELFINGQKGMVFYLGDTVSIQTPLLKIDLRFEILKGEGEFCGQISRANRPGQIGCHGAHLYDAYDWQIGLRTLRRSGACTIGLLMHYQSHQNV
jgi:hypothetical protein